MKVVLSVQAEKDLEEIGDYIAADNPSRAASFVRKLRDRCKKLATSPLAYAVRPELGRDIRCCAHGNYLILFRSSRQQVLIARIVHGARDYHALLDEI